MNEASATADDTMKLGLLMESAQLHQKLAETHLDRLSAHTRDLDGVVRAEIRRAVVDELQGVTVESERAARALRHVRRAASLRGSVWSIGIVLLCTALPAVFARLVLPSRAEVAALRVQRDALTQNLRDLERSGAKIDWRRCGHPGRLCVRIDRKAPAYGAAADYLVLQGS